MTEADPGNYDRKEMLDAISTHLTSVTDSQRFVLRYGTSIRAYLRALLPTEDAADEVEQEFMLRVVEKGFPKLVPGRGRFRDYLNVAVRNAAMAWFRKRRQEPHLVADLSQVPTAELAETESQLAWRECVLQSAWHGLRDHQMRTKGNLFHSVLRAATDFPDEDSAELAARVSAESGQPLTADAFRKQLSRARRRFAELLVAEVSQTIKDPTPELVEDELRELNFIKFVRAMLLRDR